MMAWVSLSVGHLNCYQLNTQTSIWPARPFASNFANQHMIWYGNKFKTAGEWSWLRLRMHGAISPVHSMPSLCTQGCLYISVNWLCTYNISSSQNCITAGVTTIIICMSFTFQSSKIILTSVRFISLIIKAWAWHVNLWTELLVMLVYKFALRRFTRTGYLCKRRDGLCEFRLELIFTASY
jgi:hypothetical protein